MLKSHFIDCDIFVDLPNKVRVQPRKIRVIADFGFKRKFDFRKNGLDSFCFIFSGSKSLKTQVEGRFFTLVWLLP